MPTLYLFDKREATLRDYPYRLTLNLMQMVLMRCFGISFAETRIFGSFPEEYDWQEALAFANFMIENIRPELQLRFFDPILEGLFSEGREIASEIYIQKLNEIKSKSNK